MTRDIINFDEIDENGPQEYHGTFTIDVSELDREEVSNLAPVEADARHWLELGCLFVAVGSDVGVLARQSEALAAKYKSQG